MMGKALNWIKQNPDRSVPLFMLIIVGLVFLLVFTVGRGFSSSRVDTPFEISDPEKPALQVGGVSMPRRALYGFAEAVMRQGFASSKVDYDSSALDRCKQIMEEKGQDMRDRMVSFCSGEMQRAAQQEKQIAEGMLMLAEARRRGWKPTRLQIKVVVSSLLNDLRISSGAASSKEALSRLGLTMDDINLWARIKLASDYFMAVRRKPTRAQLEKQINSNRDLYARPAEVKPAFLLSPSEEDARKVYQAFAPQVSLSAIPARLRSEKLNAELGPLQWVPVSELPDVLRRRLLSALPGQVLPVQQLQGYWTVPVAGPQKAAAPLPPFSKLRAKARVDWEINQRNRRLRRLQTKLAQWAKKSYCEKGAVEGVKLACGLVNPQ